MSASSPSESPLLASRKARFWEETDYDRAFRGSFGRYMTDVEAAALERVFPSGELGTVLDLGCGHGRFLRWLAPRARRLIGLDRSWRLLGVGRARLQDEPLAIPCRLIWGSAQEIPLGSGTVDLVTCVRVIQHLPDQDRALTEIRRVLAPGGQLLLVQYNWLSPHGLARAVKLPFKEMLRELIRFSGREPRFDEPTRWASWIGLRRQLESAGFVVERVTSAWIFPLQYFRSRRSNDAWPPFLALARALERLADRVPFRFLGGYLVVRCRPSGSSTARSIPTSNS